MTSDEILQQVNGIFRDVLDNEGVVLERSTTARDVEDWDSLNNIQLVIAVERHFKVKFTSQQIRNWKNVGEMCDALHGSLSKK